MLGLVTSIKIRNKWAPSAFDGSFFRDRLRGVTGREPDLDNGWGRWVAGQLTVRSVPGNHGSMLQHPHVEVLGKTILEELEKANRARPLPNDSSHSGG